MLPATRALSILFATPPVKYPWLVQGIVLLHATSIIPGNISPSSPGVLSSRNQVSFVRREPSDGIILFVQRCGVNTFCPRCNSLLDNNETVAEFQTCSRCGEQVPIDDSIGDPAPAVRHQQTVGKFRLIETVGEGAYGVV